MASMELPRNTKLFDGPRDPLYSYDAEAQKDINNNKPWALEPKYFTTVRISAVALIKMVMHARSGGIYEVMGLMQGYVDGTAMVITDAFRLPVEGTETRVNAQDEANEYLVQYLQRCREDGRLRSENVVGWYHSHPGYGCWLSGIDVATQLLQQAFTDPFVAVVVDPDRTISANKVDIGAFRTYPENYKAPAEGSPAPGPGMDNGSQAVPLNKADDYGAHSDKYYSLEVEHFKSSMDSKLLESLWNKYWVQTLSQNPLLTNRDYSSSQMMDLGYKINEANLALQRAKVSTMPRNIDQTMEKVVEDTKCVASKEALGLMATEVRAKIFKAQ